MNARNFAAATRTICALADKANKYVEDQAPWKLVKTDPEAARGVLTAALEAGRILTVYLKPILPDFAARVEKFLAIRPLSNGITFRRRWSRTASARSNIWWHGWIKRRWKR